MVHAFSTWRKGERKNGQHAGVPLGSLSSHFLAGEGIEGLASPRRQLPRAPSLGAVRRARSLQGWEGAPALITRPSPG